MVSDRDWHSSISFDTENILKGLQFQTNSQAEEIHIRVTATTETIREKRPDLHSLHNMVNGVTGGGGVGVTDAGMVNAIMEQGNSNGATPKYNANPIKLVITTSGALGHHNQQHNYHDIMTVPDTAYGVGSSYKINDNDDDTEDNVDDLANLDLASLLAHHEANLDMNDYYRRINHNTTLKSEPDVDELNQENQQHEQELQQEQEQEEGQEMDEPLVVEIMRDSVGGEGGGGDGFGTITQFHNDEVERQRESSTVKVSWLFGSELEHSLPVFRWH